MAESLAHGWGQKIGEVLEAGVVSLLGDFAKTHNLYLDKHGARPVRAGKNATWKDINGNEHDLDYVLERGGSPEKIGTPVAFIETAWRRYTKHSKNKAQEIHGAILPLVATHRNSAPFIGAILAGEFTNAAVQQLESLGFVVLHILYKDVLKAFAEIKIDAGFDKTTKEAKFRTKLTAWNHLSARKKKQVADRLIEINRSNVDRFIAALKRSVTRTISGVCVMPLHGSPSVLGSVSDAIAFISGYDEKKCDLPVIEYIVQIRYNTKDEVEGKFKKKEDALAFLHSYLPPQIAPVKAT